MKTVKDKQVLVGADFCGVSFEGSGVRVSAQKGLDHYGYRRAVGQ